MAKLHKLINNNTAIILNDNQEEVIIMGKGIGYMKKRGDDIDDILIEKRFILKDENINDKFKQLLADIPREHIELAGDIIDYAKIMLNKKLSDTLYISLSDHIYTSIQRFSCGVVIRNPMLWEIKRFYETEFEIGVYALEMIKERFHIELPEDEAGFIAVHIVDGQMETGSVGHVYAMTKIINDISNLVKFFFKIEFDINSVYYYRFITHIRFFAQRVVLRNTYSGNDDDSLYHIIKEKYINAYHCVQKIEQYIKKNYHYDISNDEKLYLIIHIERIVYKTEE